MNDDRSDSNVIYLHSDGPFDNAQAFEQIKDEKHVVLIGITQNKLTISMSGTPSVYEIIGLLERAKHFLVEESRGK